MARSRKNAAALTRGERNIAWIEQYCRVPEGAHVGAPVVLRPWQRAMIRAIYDTPTRRAILSMGRKNGKTSFTAFLLLLHLVGPEARRNGQLCSAAQSRDQAALLFALACKCVRQSPELLSYVTMRDTRKEIACDELGTIYRALSADASTNYGLSPALVIHDELGQVKGPRSELYDALETAAGAQAEPLSVIISTQAPTDADLLSVLIDDAIAGEDPTVKLTLHTAPADADPFAPETWAMSNPAIGDFLNAEEVARQAEDARRMPSREASFRNLILNQRINTHSPYIPPAVWKANGGEPEMDAFEEFAVVGGLDLSSRNDLTALVFAARDRAGIWHIDPKFFVPEEGIHDRSARDRVPYDLWRDQGYLIATPGSTVDYAWVAEVLHQYEVEHNITVVRFDRWRIDVLKAELAKLGSRINLEPHGQGFRDMAPAVDNLESELMQNRVRHGMNPVLTWCASNAVTVMDPVGNRKLDKSKSYGRIDGMVALAMALAGPKGDQPLPRRVSIYEDGTV